MFHLLGYGVLVSAESTITGMSLRDVRKLLDDKSPGEKALKLSAEGKNLVAAGAMSKMGVEDLSSAPIAVPHAADRSWPSEEWRLRVGLYVKMSAALEVRLSRLDAWNALTDDQRAAAAELLTSAIPSLANEMYEAEYIGLAADFPRFFVWNVLTGQERTDALIAEAGADVKTQFELVGLALHGVDLGLERLSRAIAAQQAETAPPRDPDLGARAVAQEPDPYVLDEASLGGQPAGTRAWDRLTSLWRSVPSRQGVRLPAGDSPGDRRCRPRDGTARRRAVAASARLTSGSVMM